MFGVSNLGLPKKLRMNFVEIGLHDGPYRYLKIKQTDKANLNVADSLPAKENRTEIARIPVRFDFICPNG